MLDNPFIHHLLIAVGILLLSAIVGRIIKLLANTVFQKLFSYTETTLDDRLLEVVRGKVTTLSIIGGGFISLKEIEKGIPPSEEMALQCLHYLNVALFVLLVFVVTRLVVKFVETTFDWYLEEVSQKNHSSISPTIAPLTTKLINILLFMIAAMIVLDYFGINIGSFLVSLGVGSLALALAAQETVANMIAGFVILVDQPFRIGDRIKLTTGEEGNVSQIGLRSTHIITLDNNMMVIPNSDLVKNRIINFTIPNNAIRSPIEVNIAYGSDVAKAKEIITNIVKQQPGITPEFPITVLTAGLTDYSVLLRVTIETREFTDRGPIESNIREKILKEFAANGIEIALPQRIITIKNTDGR